MERKRARRKREKNRSAHKLKRHMGDRGARPQVGRGVTGASRKAINVAQVFATEAIHALTVRGNGSGKAKTGRERRDRRGRVAHASAPVARESADPGRGDARRAARKCDEKGGGNSHVALFPAPGNRTPPFQPPPPPKFVACLRIAASERSVP